MRNLLIYAMYGGATMFSVNAYNGNYDEALIMGVLSVILAVIVFATKPKRKN